MLTRLAVLTMLAVMPLSVSAQQSQGVRIVRPFAAITEAVGQINDMAAQIASAAEEQASVTVEVNRNTENIRAMGDQMSQSSHAASAAASNLQALGRQIGSEVSKFVL